MTLVSRHRFDSSGASPPEALGRGKLGLLRAPLAAGVLALLLVSAESLSQDRSARASSPTPARAGALLLVGGGHLPEAVRDRFIRRAGGTNARIVIIPTASALPDAAAESYAYWKTAPVKSVRILHTTSRREADDPRFYEVLRGATGVWISGGDQNRLAAIYGGTGVERELKALLRRGGVVGGTSAGASAPCAVMVTGGPETGRGFGLLYGVTVDQHFSNRGRLPRLLALLHDHPGLLGLGIDEATAVMIEGGKVTVLGEGTVTAARAGGSARVYRAGGRFPLARPVMVAAR